MRDFQPFLVFAFNLHGTTKSLVVYQNHGVHIKALIHPRKITLTFYYIKYL